MTWTTQEPDPTCTKSARLGTRSISHFFLLAPFLAACGSSAQGEEATVAIDAWQAAASSRWRGGQVWKCCPQHVLNWFYLSFPVSLQEKKKAEEREVRAGTPEYLLRCPREHHPADLTRERTKVGIIANLLMAINKRNDVRTSRVQCRPSEYSGIKYHCRPSPRKGFQMLVILGTLSSKPDKSSTFSAKEYVYSVALKKTCYYL